MATDTRSLCYICTGLERKEPEPVELRHLSDKMGKYSHQYM